MTRATFLPAMNSGIFIPAALKKAFKGGAGGIRYSTVIALPDRIV
jgi:hypothetical protein